MWGGGCKAWVLPCLTCSSLPLKELGKDVEFELQLLQGLSGLRLGQ